MKGMTLGELCAYFSRYSQFTEVDMTMCDHMKTQYLMENKGNFHYEEIEEKDFCELRPYLKCMILAFYEYLADLDGATTQDWFSKYDGVVCEMEDNDIYDILKKNPLAPQNADKIYESMLARAIEPFKKRGITATVFDYTV